MAVTKFGEDLELVKVTLPVPRDSEVLIKTTYAGLCHSDLHQIDGYYDLGGEKKLTFKRQFPFCIGHEDEVVFMEICEAKSILVSLMEFTLGGCRNCGECKRGQQTCVTSHHQTI